MTRLQRWLIAAGIVLLAPACAVPKPRVTCIHGVTYVSEARSALTVAVDREGKPLPCSE